MRQVSAGIPRPALSYSPATAMPSAKTAAEACIETALGQRSGSGSSEDGPVSQPGVRMLAIAGPVAGTGLGAMGRAIDGRCGRMSRIDVVGPVIHRMRLHTILRSGGLHSRCALLRLMCGRELVEVRLCHRVDARMQGCLVVHIVPI